MCFIVESSVHRVTQSVISPFEYVIVMLGDHYFLVPESLFFENHSFFKRKKKTLAMKASLILARGRDLTDCMKRMLAQECYDTMESIEKRNLEIKSHRLDSEID